MADARRTPPPRVRGDQGLLVIAAFKLTGALLLTVVGLSALQLVNPDTAATAAAWVRELGADLESAKIREWSAQLAGLPARRFEQVGFGAFAYAGILVTQGWGLLRRRKWAEWLTVLVTASFLPLEVHELLKGVATVKVALLLVNLAIVAYLVWHLLRLRRAAEAP